MLGLIGQLLLLIAFVACAVSGAGFLLAARSSEAHEWRRLGRMGWGVMVGAVLTAAAVLGYLFVTHQFQYAYVYQNSSLDLPMHYLVSSFWAGQEGSFLLWIAYTGLVGWALIKWAKDYEAPVMTVVAICQLFLLSMILGLQLGPLTIGSSPFETLAEAFPNAPIFQQNPDFVPADGTGLNDLLQNPWMTIHPPTLFVGFATMIAPFAYAVAALWKRQYTQWVKPALPWMLLANLVLGIGIALGGYWAYVTLSFGGYWAWDPVENSSLVPWLVGVAGLHAMLIQKKSGNGHKAALLLSILSFLLVVYSTFLTRSGILGDISVHSFVDLGLYTQLVAWIGTMAVVGFGLFAYRYRELPEPTREPNVLSREFMIFTGAMLLCAMAAVILLGTSSPIFGRLFRDNPSGVPIQFYNKWTLPMSIVVVFLGGLGQLFWWNKMTVERINRVLLKPVALSTAATVAVLLFTPFVERTVTPVAAAADTVVQAGLGGSLSTFWEAYGLSLQLLLLVFVGFFALFGNGAVLWRVARGNLRMAGGSLTHVGFALVILGIVASSGFNHPLGSEGVQIGDSRDNFVLTRGEARDVSGYTVRYSGTRATDDGHTAYVLDFEDPRGRSFQLAPVVYKTEEDQWIQHPDLQIWAEKDLYAAITPSAMMSGGDQQNGELRLGRGDSTVIGDREYGVRFVNFDMNVPEELVPDSADIAVGAQLNVTNFGTGETRTLRPVYLIMNDRSVRFVQNRVADWGITVSFAGMNVNTGEITLMFEGVDVMPEDWVVVQAYEKPFISVLWIGIILLSLGLVVSYVRRIQDLQFDARRAVG